MITEHARKDVWETDLTSHCQEHGSVCEFGVHECEHARVCAYCACVWRPEGCQVTSTLMVTSFVAAELAIEAESASLLV